MKAPRIRWTLLFLPLLVLLPSACGDNITEEIFEAENDRPIDITLRNLDNVPVHLFSRFETFPCCQVAPNDDRTVTVLAQPGEVIQFSAGRNQVIIDTQSCTVHALQYPSEGAALPGVGGNVDFLITEDLVCTGHWN